MSFGQGTAPGHCEVWIDWLVSCCGSSKLNKCDRFAAAAGEWQFSHFLPSSPTCGTSLPKL